MSTRCLFSYLSVANVTCPEKIALYDRYRIFSYTKLEKITNQMAHFFLNMDVKRGDRIAVFYVEKDALYVISMLAIMKVGAIYVPVNSKLSIQQVNQVLEDSKPDILLCDIVDYTIPQNTKAVFISNYKDCKNSQLLSDVMELDFNTLDQFSNILPNVKVFGNDIAYIIYTSGSTGKPKGVMISHENLISVVEWRKEALEFKFETKLMSLAPMYFDTNFLEIFCTLSKMGEIYIFDTNNYAITKLIKDIDKYKITKFFCVPAIALMLLELKHKLLDYDLTQMDMIVVSGGAIAINNIVNLSKIFVNANFYNGYGLTETSVSATLFKMGNSRNLIHEEIPLGKTMDEGEFYVVDKNNNPVNPGEVGELVIRGPNVMQGYWRNIEMTDKVLKKNPMYPHLTEKVLYTGDLVKLDNSNNIFFMGRKDDQIKTSGYRVELGEIEGIISGFGFVNDCCVVAVDDEKMGKKICCFLTLRDQNIKIEDIAKICSNNMSHYMVPHSWRITDELPKLSNDKIDRTAIKMMAIE